MKKIAIQRGTFSTEGRFTGFNASGQKFYIGATMLKGLGITSETPIDEIAFPLFILCTEETRTTKAGVEYERWEAQSAFKTMDAMLDASIADQAMDILAEQKLAQLAQSVGLTTAILTARVAQSV